MTDFQMAHPFNAEGDNIKAEPSPNEYLLWPLVQDRRIPLPPISEWYNDSTDTRRSSTSSSSTALTSEARSPVDPIGDLDQYVRATRRLIQLSGHMLSSPYPSPGSTPGPEDHIVQKSKAKAKTRSLRGVIHAPDDAFPKDSAQETMGQKKVKANRERDARFEQSQSLSRAWEECLITNPNFIHEGVTRDGKRGLRQLKRNNIDERIEEAGHIPNQINKDQLIDLLTLLQRQLRELNIRQIENHRMKGRYDEALELQRELRAVGTYL